jgi:branched-subunit amino acid transport protein
VSHTWTTIIVLTVATAAIRAAGPVLVGPRELPVPVLRVIALLAPALLAALIAIGTFTDPDGDLVLDARAAGLAAAAGVLTWRQNAMLGAALAAALTAAIVRALA